VEQGARKILGLTESSTLCHSPDIHELEIFHAREMVPVPAQQRQAVDQGDSGNQAVRHADSLACAVEFALHGGCLRSRSAIQR